MRHNIRFVDILGFSWGLSLCVGLLLSVVANADDLSGSEPGNSILKSDAAESWDNEMNRPIHTSWGAEDYSNDFSHSPPDGVPLSVSSSYIKTTFGVTKDPAVSDLSRELRRSFAALRSMWPWLPSSKHRRSSSAQSKHSQHRAHVASKLPKGASMVGPSTGTLGLDAKGLILQSTDQANHVLRVGQQEEGTNPEWQICPDYGLDSKEFIVSGSTEYSWVKTVQFLSMEGSVLGTIRRGCPALVDSFSWTVPKDEAEGCRNGIEPAPLSALDPSIVAPDCQELERQVLYTDEWGGLLSQSSTKVMDCHDDLLFKMYQERRDLYVGQYMIHSDFAVQGPDGNVVGYCKLDSPVQGLKSVGEYNFTIVDLSGRAMAQARRPLRWPGGSREHAWHVTILDTEGPDVGGALITDMRVVAVAVANYVLLHQPADLCSDAVLMLLPMACTLAVIGLLAGFSAARSIFAPAPAKP